MKFTDSQIKKTNIAELVKKNRTEELFLVNKKICLEVGKQTFEVGKLKIEICSIPKITHTDKGTIGYEVLVRAWEDGKQLGFGADGSVEIERIRNFGFANFLIEDENGEIEKTFGGFVPSLGKEIFITKKYRVDLRTSVLNDIAHTVSLIGKKNTKIEIGKIGKTTDTFNPLRISGQRSGTGYFAKSAGGGNFATWRGATSATHISTAGLDPDYCYIQMEKNGASSYGWNVRAWGNFDTSSIPDTNTIDSATISIKPSGSVFNPPTDPLTGTKLNITAFSPADSRNVTNTDMDNFSDTKFATDYNWSSLSIGTYSDLTLNSDGLNYINKTGDTCLFWRMNWDIENTAPSATSGNTGASFDFGTTNPQKLVVTHSGVASTFIPKIMMS